MRIFIDAGNERLVETSDLGEPGLSEEAGQFAVAAANMIYRLLRHRGGGSIIMTCNGRRAEIDLKLHDSQRREEFRATRSVLPESERLSPSISLPDALCSATGCAREEKNSL